MIPFCHLFLLLLGDGPIFSVTDHTHTDHGRVTDELFPLKWGFPSVPSGMWGHRRWGRLPAMPIRLDRMSFNKILKLEQT